MEQLEVRDEGTGIIRGDVNAKLVNRRLAEELCNEIERVAARYPGRARLLMNLGALSKATPSAGIYAVRRMKELDLVAIALFKANGFVKGFARTVMRFAGFKSFGLFEDEPGARSWLERVPDRAPRP